MGEPLRVLMVEDSEDDVLLTVRALKKGGYDPVFARVEDAGAMLKALQKKTWDVILCDYKMPQFNGLAAIALLKETGIDIPLIIVSGAIGEETAVECMRSGAHDYVMKGNLSRLVPAIERELKESIVRRERERSEEALRENEERFRRVSSMISDVAYSCSMKEDGIFSIDWMTGGTERISGYSIEEIKAQKCWRSLVIDEDLTLFDDNVTGLPPGSHASCELRIQHKSGAIAWVESYAECVRMETPESFILYGALVDITERKRAGESLQDSQELLSLFMRHSPIYTYIKEVTPTESRVLQASDNYDQMIGIPGPKMIGRTMHELFPQEFAEKITADDWAVVSSGNVLQLDEDLNDRNYTTIKFPIYQRGKTLLAGYTIDITERKRAEEALRESETKYNELAHFLPQIVFETDMTGNITFVNHAAYTISGYSPEDVKRGFNVLQLLVPEDRDRAILNIQRILHGEELRGSEYTFLRKDGHTFPIMTESVPIVQNNQTLGMRGFVIDITERKRMEAMLRESAEKYREIFESITDVFYRTDNEGRLLIVSPSVEQLLGYIPDEIIGRKLDESYINPQERDQFLSVLREKGVAKGFEAALRAKDGSVVNVSTNAQFYRDKQGKILGIQGVSRDITERSRMEDTLRKSEANYKQLFDNAPAAIYQINFRTGKFIKANDVLCEYIGCSQEKITSLSPYDCMTKESQKLLLERLSKMAQGDKVPEDPEYEIIDKNGKRRWLQLNSKNIYDSEGLLGADVVAHDITDRKKAEEDLEKTLESLRKALGTTIQVMVSAVESRDPYTSGHQIRSADLARAIATEMGLPPEKIDGIRMAGSIHDIGKLSIPAEILSKPTKLTNIEFSLIKEHSLKGYEMLKDVESPWPLAQIVYQHHERMDGSGYPRNLKGEDILIEARIMAVADVVESMASHRPYRPALGIEPALEEIEKNKGILYDDTVVDTCLRLFREKGFQLEGT